MLRCKLSYYLGGNIDRNFFCNLPIFSIKYYYLMELIYIFNLKWKLNFTCEAASTIFKLSNNLLYWISLFPNKGCKLEEEKKVNYSLNIFFR